MENPYAPPRDLDADTVATQLDSGDTSVSREGNLAVCANQATWPDRCVMCNEPTNTPKLTRKLFWHPSGYYLLFLVSWLIYLIVAMIVRKKGIIHISLCDHHRQRRKNGIWIGIVGFVASFALIFVGTALSDSSGAGGGALAVLGIIGVIAAPITGALMARTVTPNKITDTHLWLRTGKPFIDSL